MARQQCGATVAANSIVVVFMLPADALHLYYYLFIRRERARLRTSDARFTTTKYTEAPVCRLCWRALFAGTFTVWVANSEAAELSEIKRRHTNTRSVCNSPEKETTHDCSSSTQQQHRQQQQRRRQGAIMETTETACVAPFICKLDAFSTEGTRVVSVRWLRLGRCHELVHE